MGFLIKLGRWVWGFFRVFAPFVPLLWGVALYSGLAYSLYSIVSSTASVIGYLSSTFAQWADGLSSGIASFFDTVSGNSLFELLAYVTSLDVVFEWFRSLAESFVGSWLSYIVGVLISVIELALVVLGFYFVRSRLKIISSGLSGGNE